jgi:hypothetical protein
MQHDRADNRDTLGALSLILHEIGPPGVVCPPAIPRGDRRAQRLARGQLPNALSHLTLINVVMHLIRADQQLSYRSAWAAVGFGLTVGAITRTDERERPRRGTSLTAGAALAGDAPRG